ncbi:hypothetical protein B6E66_04145 [Streptomyces maremycinicus]|nr:hypothetical protein B6E66_04145 [Streptomyces sp. B9173]
MHGVTRDARLMEHRRDRIHTSPISEREPSDSPLTWRSAGLETMASMLVLSLRRLGPRGFEARCQWPRSHPLNERGLVVVHHPLIMVESVRQIGVVLERRFLPNASVLLEPDSVRWGLVPGAQPREGGVATAVRVRVAVSDVMLEGGRLVGYRVCADFLHEDLWFGSCTIRTVPREPGAAAGTGAHTGVLYPPAAAVGAAAEPDVMVARSSRGQLLIMPRDPDHPVFLTGRSPRLTAVAVLEAGRQAALLSCGLTATAVTGLSVDVRGAVPCAGASVDVISDPSGRRFTVLAHGHGHVTAFGTVGLLRP